MLDGWRVGPGWGVGFGCLGSGVSPGGGDGTDRADGWLDETVA